MKPLVAAILLLLTGLPYPVLSLSATPVPEAAGEAETDARNWGAYKGWKLTGFRVTGLPEEFDGNVAKGLRLRGRARILRGVVRPSFTPGLLVEDMDRIGFYLARRGYPAARVIPVFDPDLEARTLALTLVVEPGPMVTVQDVAYSGWPPDLTLPDANDKNVIQPGDRFADEAVLAMSRFLRFRLLDAGYASAVIEPRLTRAGPGAVAVEFVVEPGGVSTFTVVDITGASENLVSVAKRVMDIAPGDRYGETRMIEAAENLRMTSLFRHVELQTQPLAPGDLHLTATLADARMRTWRASVGTWSDNPWMVRAGWTHANLFKGGRGLNLRGVYATHDRQIGAEMFWLGWLSPRARSSVALDMLNEDEDAYRSEEFRLEFVQSFRPRGRAIWSVGTSLSRNRVETYSQDYYDDIPENQDLLWELWGDRKWDWTDDVLFPTAGGFLKISATAAPPAPIFEAAYLKGQVDGSIYRSLLGPVTGAARARYGWSMPLESNPDLLANRRFYAGGYNSMRGYERRRLGPKDTENNPRGGQSVLLGGVELRTDLFWQFVGAVFVDAGQVWRFADEIALDDISVAVGAGLGIKTPLGPLRLDYAYNVSNLLENEPRSIWQFGIGYPW